MTTGNGEILDTRRRSTDVAAYLRLLHRPDDVWEVRAPKCADRAGGSYKQLTASGYFKGSEVDKAAQAIAILEQAEPAGIYTTINPVAPAAYARAAGRVNRRAEDTTGDSNILARRWLFLDIDAIRDRDIKGISATDDEMAAALALAENIQAELAAAGWGEGLFGMSGNGAYLFYRVDLPNDAAALDLVTRVLKGLAARFDTAGAKVDTGVHNASRIAKILGTVARKGDDTPDRPHRQSWFVPPADELQPVPVDLLEAMAAPPDIATTTTSKGTAGPFDVERYIRRHQFDVSAAKVWKGSGRRWVFNKSPLCDHHDGAAFVVQGPDGAPGAGCHHQSCTWSVKDLFRRYPPERPAATAKSDDDDDDTPLDDPYPGPPADECFYGLAGDIVRAIEPHSEADPIAIHLQLLCGFGNLIGRSAHFRVEGDWHSAKLFAAIVGNTSKGRKGTSEGQVRRIVRSVDPLWAEARIGNGLSSGEGLIWAVRDPIYKTERTKEKGIVRYEQVEADPGISDKRLLIVESELGSVLRVLKREQNTLSAIIRDCWDKDCLRSMTKNSPAVSTGCHISIIGHITRDELRRHVTETDMANGLCNRFLWVCVRRSKCLPEGGSIQDVDFAPLVARMKAAATFAKTCAEVRRDEAAKEIWAAVYPELSAGKPGLLGAATSRAEAQVMRVAMIFALLDCSNLIRPEHLTAALAIWDYCEASARYIFGSKLGDPVADEILRALRTAPAGLTRTELRDHFGRNATAADIGRALGMLSSTGLARSVKEVTGDRGRPTERWHAT